MMNYYTAIGRYELRANEQGVERPVLLCAAREYVPTVCEMTLWSALLWHIKDVRSLEEEFERKRAELHLADERSFAYYLRRLELLGFLRCGTGYTAADALYDLMAPLYLVPATASLWTRLCTFFHLLVRRHVPIEVARRVFYPDKLNLDEQQIMNLLAQNSLSTAELIACIDQDLDDIRDDAVIMANLYGQPEITCDNLPVYTRASTRLVPILQAVTNLYLRRLIVLDQY